MSGSSLIRVALGVVWRCPDAGALSAEAQVLIARRAADAVLGGHWEFPGGKLEAGESPEACVVRELREELGVEVRLTLALGAIEHRYAHGAVRLMPYLCELSQGTPRPLAATELRWVDVQALGEIDFPPANAGLVREIRREAGL